MKRSATPSAFSLVELSIVLVILGLLTGGILGGQSLIRAAELRAVTTEYNRWVTATRTFQDKYFALPGDMTNAQSFWGVAHATPSVCEVTPSTTTATCNGDGNGQVSYYAVGNSANESFRFWQHLANAGLIEGTYDGVTHGSNVYSATSANVPKSRLGNGHWHISHWGPVTGDAYLFDGQYGNAMVVGGLLANDWPNMSLFKPEELWNIDTKLDDGRPAQGKVLSGGLFANCTTAANSADLNADYRLNQPAVSCFLMSRNNF